MEAKARDPALVRQAWERGILSWKLRPHQKKLYDAIAGWSALIGVVKCARRFGKSYVVCLYSCEFALKHPGCQIRFAAPTEKALRKIIRPNLQKILADCPPDLRPQWRSQDSCLVFHNGAEWHFGGTDKDNVEKLRGTGADLVVVDEAGFVDDLEYVVNDVLLPQTIDNGGRMILISTPPYTPGHPFNTFALKAEIANAFIRQTVDDNTHVTEAVRKKYADSVGGFNSSTWKREYLVQDVIDEKAAVVPEFDEKARSEIVCEFQIPTHRNVFEAMDVGWGHFTADLFAFYDFERAKLCIEDEVIIRKMVTSDLAAAIKQKELQLWGDPKSIENPGLKVFGRWSDVAPQLIHDLSVTHGVHFVATEKDDFHTAVNKVRLWIQQRRIEIHPRCKTLINHLSYAIWNKARTTFQESDAHGHYDALAALVYLVRNVPEHVNPFPVMKAGNYKDAIVLPSSATETKTAAAVRQIFRRPR